ncbi:MAG: hypothetical protein HYZ65_15310 [Burkholderiales bacterium]|nr:hypothetical protein [Burkholderiales bacterium]
MRITLVSLFAALCLFLTQAQASAFEYEVKTVAYKNLVARLYLPKVQGKVPVVLAFGGSDGGLHFGNANGEMLAPHGLAVLALAYFKEEGLPATLDRIPLEYFVSALDFLETEAALDATKIGVVSGSRGSEAALLLASIDARIKSVVVTTPSNVAWYGRTLARSAWTLKGNDVPALSLELDESAPQVSRFVAALKNEKNVQKARFALESINGPVLLVSAEDDQFWPSYQMSINMVAYLKQHNFKYAVTHHSYATGHMFSKETAPAIKQTIIDHFVHTL